MSPHASPIGRFPNSRQAATIAGVAECQRNRRQRDTQRFQPGTSAIDTTAATRSEDDGSGLLTLSLISLVAGVATGLVGALFRLSLDYVDDLRNILIERAHAAPAFGLMLVVAICAAATAVAAWLVRRFSPLASGSGIPHVEAVLNGELPPTPLSMIPVKFGGGVLAIGAGLALGREGPSVQMGAGISHLCGRIFGSNWSDCRVLIAAGAGAGLATAFNSPIAGAIFVLEELVRRFEPRIAIAALGASATAITVARVFLGEAPDFAVEDLNYVSAGSQPLYLILGIAAGLLAVAYNRTLLGAIAAAGRLDRWPVELRAAVVGGGVGLLAWFEPHLVGGGDVITQSTLGGNTAISMLPWIFLLRFGLGSISYAARTPGGLFAPMLVLGAQLGLFFGACCQSAFPNLGIQPEAFAVIGMAAFFTGVVRAPITGMVLVVEMTGCFALLLPMLGACFTAMLVPTLLRNLPIYEALRERRTSIPADR